MSKRFMRVKRIVLPALAAFVLMGTFVGCGNSNSELYELMQNTSEITIELVEPAYRINIRGEDSAKESLAWIQLDQLKTYNDFRQAFDRALGIKVVTNEGENGKSGCLYVDETGDRNGNTTLEDAFRNKIFIEKYWNNSDTRKEISELASMAYGDVEDLKEEGKLYASLNAYYNLLVDNENPDSFNGNQSVSREQFMSAMYRMNHAVNEEYLTGWNPETDAFAKATGLSVYTAEAKQMADYSWLDYGNGSLNTQTSKQSMSRLEAVYMAVKANFPTQYDSYDMNKSIAFTDVKNAGDLTGSKKENDTEKNREKDKWQLYVLHMLLDNHSHGIQEELYRAVGVASELNLVSPDGNGELRWDEPISKQETIELMVNIELAKNKLEGYKTSVEDGKVNVEKFKVTYGGIDSNGQVIEEEQGGSSEGEVTQSVQPEQGQETNENQTQSQTPVQSQTTSQPTQTTSTPTQTTSTPTQTTSQATSKPVQTASTPVQSQQQSQQQQSQQVQSQSNNGFGGYAGTGVSQEEVEAARLRAQQRAEEIQKNWELGQ